MCAIKRGWRMAGSPESVRQVRGYIAATLSPFATAEVVDAAELAVSELAGNAVRHTASGRDCGSYEVALVIDGGRIRIAVTDQGAMTTPRVATGEALVAPDAIGGRGLGLLAGLGATVAWEGDHTGHRVWADLPIGGGGATR